VGQVPGLFRSAAPHSQAFSLDRSAETGAALIWQQYMELLQGATKPAARIYGTGSLVAWTSLQKNQPGAIFGLSAHCAYFPCEQFDLGS
jgi:hypothetical protein